MAKAAASSKRPARSRHRDRPDPLGVTIADLVAGETDRERLFAELRGKPAALVRSLRDTVRRGD